MGVMRAIGPRRYGGSVTDPMATRIVEVQIRADGAPLLLVDGVPVDLAQGDDPERAGMGLVADDARRVGRCVSAVLVLDGGSTRWAVQVHPDGTVTDQPDDAPPASQGRRPPLAWLAGAAALALLAGGGYVAVTTSTPGPGAPATPGVAVPTWAAELPAEPARPSSAPAPAPAPATPAPTPTPTLALAAAVPESESEPLSPSTRATERRVRAPAATEQSSPDPSAADPVSTRPDELRAPAPLVEQEPATVAPSSPGTGSSQRARSQRPSTRASATPSVSSSQRGQSGN